MKIAIKFSAKGQSQLKMVDLEELQLFFEDRDLIDLYSGAGFDIGFETDFENLLDDLLQGNDGLDDSTGNINAEVLASGAVHRQDYPGTFVVVRKINGDIPTDLERQEIESA